jgi:Sulfotransferase domain
METINSQNHNSTLPTFLIIGAMKAGTTSLHRYLSAHPEIFMSEIKELNFFNTSLNWNKGIDWYKSQFNVNYKIRGESSPNYAKWEGTAERVHSILPNAKIIYLLRDPIKRFVSQCNHQQIDPNQVVQNLKNGMASEIFSNSLYSQWYKEYNTYYKKRDILILKSEDLRHSRKDVLLRVFRFLNADANLYNFESDQLKAELHNTTIKPIASNKINNLNKYKTYDLVKRLIKPIIPVLKPLQSKLFYSKRIIKDLNMENKIYLADQFRTDINALEKELGVTLNYEY